MTNGNYKHLKLTDDGQRQCEAIAGWFDALETMLLGERKPNCREESLLITHLEMACVYAKKAVANRTMAPLIDVDRLRAQAMPIVSPVPSVAEVMKPRTAFMAKAGGPRIIFVVNGELTDVYLDPDAKETLRTCAELALQQTANIGRPPRDWEARKIDGTTLDLDAPARGNLFVFLSLRIGAGG